MLAFWAVAFRLFVRLPAAHVAERCDVKKREGSQQEAVEGLQLHAKRIYNQS
jgi:hypothetical protein